MKMMILISAVLTVAYTAVVSLRARKVPESISSLVFRLKGAWRWSWTLWLWAVALCVGIPTIEALGESWKFVGFLMLSALMFVGALPLFQEEHERAHGILAVGAGVLSQVCVALLSPWWLLLWLLFVGYGALCVWDYQTGKEDKWYHCKGVLVAEVICYLSLVCAVV